MKVKAMPKATAWVWYISTYESAKRRPFAHIFGLLFVTIFTVLAHPPFLTTATHQSILCKKKTSPHKITNFKSLLFAYQLVYISTYHLQKEDLSLQKEDLMI